MFPIPWNKAFRKKDGTIVNMEDLSGGGSGGSLPPHSAEDAGKVLGVANDGSLAWISVTSGEYRMPRAKSNLSKSNISSKGSEVV